jgi:hypothetical protein
MTTIHDISNNLINTYKNYIHSRDEMYYLYDEYKRKRNELSHMSFNDCYDLLYKEVIELIILRERTDYLKHKYDYAHYLSGSNIQSVKLSTKKMRSLHPEMCGVCMEHHTYSNMIITSCHHYFGKECFSKWIHTCFVKRKDISCTLCRNTKFTITRYIAKKH